MERKRNGNVAKKLYEKWYCMKYDKRWDEKTGKFVPKEKVLLAGTTKFFIIAIDTMQILTGCIRVFIGKNYMAIIPMLFSAASLLMLKMVNGNFKNKFLLEMLSAIFFAIGVAIFFAI